MIPFPSIFSATRAALSGLVAIATVIAVAPAAQAVPTLQVYIEGATYDGQEESWKITSPANAPLRLWAVGNVAGPGGKGPIYDVKAAFAYSSGAGNISIDIASSTTNGLGGFTDPSASAAPTLIATHSGGRPVRADGKKLAKHGVYGKNTNWQEWSFGDFTSTDSPIADFMDAFPQAPIETTGQINAYEINVTGLAEGEWIHVDLYGSILNRNGRVKGVFAPFSHDAEFAFLGAPVSSTEVHAPGAALIFGAAFVFLARRRAHKKNA